MVKEKTKQGVLGMTKRPTANPVVVLREEFDDWAILFNPDTADAVGTNPVGVAVWKLMDGKHGIPDIIAEIKYQFADVPDSVTKEIPAFIKDLTQRGFVGYELEG